MDTERVGGWTLLLCAGAGVAACVVAPGRWGRPRGALVIAGLSVLAARDGVMIASGTVQRLRIAPAVLLVAEPACAVAGIALGVRAYRRPPMPGSGLSGQGTGARSPSADMLARPAALLAAMTFGIHALRQAIYLTPGQGRREPPAARVSSYG